MLAHNFNMNFAILILMVFFAAASKNPDGGFTFDPNMSDEDYAIYDDSEPDVVLLPSSDNESEDIRVVGQSTREGGQSSDPSEGDKNEIRVVGQSTKDGVPPPSPDVIEIVAVDENSRRRQPSRKRPAPLNPTSSKNPRYVSRRIKIPDQSYYKIQL